MSAARLLALDWGTSSLRAYVLGDGGAVLEERSKPWGIMHLPEGGFEAALRGIAGDRLQLPIIASGMVGSAQGWREARYVDCPAGADQLADALLAFDALPGVRLHIVPGVRDARPDVMRGEETQVVGALSRSAELHERATLLMPGTHSKWVRVEAGRIVGFQTVMTGELYALLAEHSILGRPARSAHAAGDSADAAAFETGVAAVRDAGEAGASALLFGARARVLCGQLKAADSLEYLSGVLIGEELRIALPVGAPAALIGAATLCARYQRALTVWGVPGAAPIDAAAVPGLWTLASRAGLV
jgi:2-dehydro-3-deoxygalactonokinase